MLFWNKFLDILWHACCSEAEEFTEYIRDDAEIIYSPVLTRANMHGLAQDVRIHARMWCKSWISAEWNPWEQNSLPCGFLECCVSPIDKDWDRRNADWHLQPPIFQHISLHKKARRHYFFLLFAFISNISLNMSKQTETQARHNHCFSQDILFFIRLSILNCLPIMEIAQAMLMCTFYICCPHDSPNPPCVTWQKIQPKAAKC